MCLLNRRLSASQSRSRPFYRRQRSLASAGIRTPDHPVHSLFTILTMLSSLPFLPFTSKYSTKHSILKNPYSLNIINFVSFNHHYITSNQHIAGDWTYLHHQVKGKHTHTYSDWCDRRTYSQSLDSLCQLTTYISCMHLG